MYKRLDYATQSRQEQKDDSVEKQEKTNILPALYIEDDDSSLWNAILTAKETGINSKLATYK